MISNKRVTSKIDLKEILQLEEKLKNQGHLNSFESQMAIQSVMSSLKQVSSFGHVRTNSNDQQSSLNDISLQHDSKHSTEPPEFSKCSDFAEKVKQRRILRDHQFKSQHEKSLSDIDQGIFDQIEKIYHQKHGSRLPDQFLALKLSKNNNK